VLAGSILGTVISYFAYRQYYPSLASEISHRPYAPRIPREELPRQTRLRHASGERSSRQKDRDHAEDIIESGPLEGTVIRGGPNTLREVWSDGADREGTTALDSPGGAHDGIPLESV
jgi:diacylglycerol diphosphate phosphatase/phosphatidate phosphatase